MISEVDFSKGIRFCVYTHSRPDGSVFYVGKGVEKRAHDFAPSRRTLHHKNVVSKYGRENIKVHVIPCMSETEAFMLERVHIKIARDAGKTLVNLTDGGEGGSGRKFTKEQLAAHVEAAKRGWDKRGRKPAKGAIEYPTEPCKMCGAEYKKKSKRNLFCCENCQQRYVRSLVPKVATKIYKTNSTGRTGVYQDKTCGKWKAAIGVNKKLIHLGTFENKEDAIRAREAAENGANKRSDS